MYIIKQRGENMNRHFDNSQRIDLVREKEFNTCSATDCTGLIPSAIVNESQIDAYEEIYPYLSPTAGQDEA